MHKAIVTLLLIFLAMPVKGQDAPPKNSSSIIVQVDGSKEELFKKITVHLISSGFLIETSDIETGLISTKGKGVKQSTKVWVNVIVDSSKVTISGLLHVQVSDIPENPKPVKYRGMRRSPPRFAWAELEALADSLGGIKEYK